jgi:hypothetical protein
MLFLTRWRERKSLPFSGFKPQSFSRSYIPTELFQLIFLFEVLVPTFFPYRPRKQTGLLSVILDPFFHRFFKFLENTVVLVYPFYVLHLGLLNSRLCPTVFHFSRASSVLKLKTLPEKNPVFPTTTVYSDPVTHTCTSTGTCSVQERILNSEVHTFKLAEFI